MPKKYSEDLKMEVTRRHERGESVKSLSQELGIAQSTIHDWFKKVSLHRDIYTKLYSRRF